MASLRFFGFAGVAPRTVTVFFCTGSRAIGFCVSTVKCFLNLEVRHDSSSAESVEGVGIN
jgi:hypothetical protein